MRNGLSCVLRSAIVFLLALPCAAQVQDRAEISGRVSDQTGAVLSGVAVILRNDVTGYQTSTVSTPTGDFVFPFVAIGPYTLTAKVAGFQEVTVNGIRLSLYQKLNLPIVLTVGAVQSQLTVITESNAIDSTDATLKTVLTEQQIKDFPIVLDINGRSAQDALALLTMGSSNYDFMGQKAQGSKKISINGSAVGGVGYTFDGVDNTALSEGGGGAVSNGPNPDALAEFSILAHTFKADSGNQSAIVSLETKSGTNVFHGQVRIFHVDPTMSARDFFDTTRKTGWWTDAAGFQFSGPVRIPTFYDGSNKTLFFFDTEVTRARKSYELISSVLSDAERAGNFSNLPPSEWPRDPMTGQPFSGGQIPANRVLPQSRFFIDNLMRTPTSGMGVDNPFTERPGTREMTGRIDHRFSANDTLSVSAFESKWFTTETEAEMLGTLENYRTWTHNLSVHEIHTISPRMSNSLTFGQSYSRYDEQDQGKLPVNPSLNGFKITTSYLAAYPRVRIDSISGFYAGGERYVDVISDWTMKNDFSFIRHSNAFKTGVEIRHLTGAYFDSGFSSAGFDSSTPYGTGNDAADFLLGIPSSYSQASPASVHPRQFAGALYLQSDFKLRPRVSLNAGLRYELGTRWSEANGYATQFRPGAQSKVFPNAPAGLLFPGDVDPSTSRPIGKDVIPSGGNHFAPRIGLVSSLSNHTAVRLGYGIYYIAPAARAAKDMFYVPPFYISASRDASQIGPAGGSFLNPWGRDADPFAASEVQRQFSLPLGGVTFVEPNARKPYEQQWTLSIERQLPRAVILDVAYAGNASVHLYRQYDANPGILTATASRFDVQARRLYQNFSAVKAYTTDGRSSYNALQVSLNRRFASRAEFNGSYVWSKALDNAGSGPIQLWTYANRDITPWALSNHDRRHQFVVNGVSELPAIPLKHLDKLSAGWRITAIYQARAGLPMNIRNPYDSTLRTAPNNAVDDTTTAEITGPFRMLDPRQMYTFKLPNGRSMTAHFLFDPTVFKIFDPVGAAQARPGNFGRNVFSGPGIDNLDLSVSKRIRLGESQNVDIRIDTTNFLNQAQFVPDRRRGFLTDNPFFAVTDMTTGARRIQFVLKYSF